MWMEWIDKTGRILSPVLIHFLAANIINMMGLHADAAFLTSITAVLVLPLFLRMYAQDRKRQPNEAASAMRTADFVWIAALGIVCNFLLTALMNILMQKVALSNQAQESLFASGFLIQLVGLGVLVPAAEEVLFRGLVYNRLRGYTRNTWIASLLAAAIFTVYHGNVLQMLFAFPMALILNALYCRWNTLKPCVTFHMAVNVSSVLVTAIMGSK